MRRFHSSSARVAASVPPADARERPTCPMSTRPKRDYR
jgi:hypothetical protein